MSSLPQYIPRVGNILTRSQLLGIRFILLQTVIFDCCHSASMDRDEEADESTSRYLSDPPPVTAEANIIPATIVEALDDDPTRGVSLAPGFGSPSATSHVLLAACGRDGRAYENHEAKHGYFTDALLKFLLKSKDLKTETYLSLISALAMPTW